MVSYFIKTYGCQMNVNDSEVMAGILHGAGYLEALSPDEADVILINTCCVRQKAEDKAMGYALGLVAQKMRKPGRVIGITGCIAEKDKAAIFRKLPFIDLVIGPGQEKNIIQLIEGIKKGDQKVVSTGESCSDYHFKTTKRKPASQAFITIMFGCNNFCSYCIVPYVRGSEISRPAKDIIEEIKGLDKNIFKEVVLLGQNVNSYQGSGTGGTGKGLAGLLEEASKVDGVQRIRFFTSHPRDMSDEIINAVKDLPKVCEFFHLPLQSGDDEVLAKMNRGYTSDQFRILVNKIRSKIPEAAITSDAIAGFPGETEEQFNNTLRLIKELELDLVNTFNYSIRPGTAAAKMDGQLSKDIISERLQRLMTVVEETAFKKNQKLIGTEQEVLVDKRSSKDLIGRTRGNKTVLFGGPDELIGKLVNVRVIEAKPWVLIGKHMQ